MKRNKHKIIVLLLLFGFCFNSIGRNNGYTTTKLPFDIVEVYSFELDLSNSELPINPQGPSGTTCPPMLIVDSRGNNYVMVLREHPYFYSPSTQQIYRSKENIPIEERDPYSLSSLKLYPFFPLISGNRFIWFTRTQEGVKYTTFELQNLADGSLDFKKMGEFFIQDIMYDSIHNFVSAELKNNTLFVSLNDSLLAIDLTTNKRLWEISIPYISRGLFKYINSNLLVMETYVFDENGKLKYVFMEGISPKNGNLLWKEEIKNQVKKLFSVNCTYKDNQLVSVTNQGEFNSCVILDHNYKIILINHEGKEMQSATYPTPYGLFTILYPFTDQDYTIFNNTLYLTTNLPSASSLKYYNFLSQEFLNIDRKKENQENVEWKKPIVYNNNYPPIILELNYSKRSDVQIWNFYFLVNTYSGKKDLLFLSNIHKLPDPSCSNPISIGNNQFAIVTYKRIRIFQVRNNLQANK